MKLYRLNETDTEVVAEAVVFALRQPGGVALVPTETVYGLIARAGDTTAEKRIFELKHRNASKRVGWFVGDWRKLSKSGVILDGWPEKLASLYCPGALTIIARCANGSTQGFRVPDSELLLKVLEKMDVPLLQTSANASGMPDARSCQEALSQLAGDVDCAVDGGIIPGDAQASTVVDATEERIKILRQGKIDLQNLL